jgi:ferredoxin
VIRVRVDAEECIGSGLCALIAPDVFDQDDDGVVVLLDEQPPATAHAAVREAASRCPAAVIAIIEED